MYTQEFERSAAQQDQDRDHLRQPQAVLVSTIHNRDEELYRTRMELRQTQLELRGAQQREVRLIRANADMEKDLRGLLADRSKMEALQLSVKDLTTRQRDKGSGYSESNGGEENVDPALQ